MNPKTITRNMGGKVETVIVDGDAYNSHPMVGQVHVRDASPGFAEGTLSLKRADAKKRIEDLGKKVAEVIADAEKKAADRRADIKAHVDRAKDNIGMRIEK